MVRILLLFISFFSLLTVQAQGVVRQKGYVRSVGRPDNKAGKRLSGALLRVSGQHNTVRSGQNGLFILEFKGLREGKDSYSFSSVRLTGYDLQENGMLGRPYPLSSTVPVEVVLVPQSLKVEIEERVRRTVETQYQKKLKRIESLRAKDAERYRAELQRLESEYEKRDQLINDMVERYASTDYAHLDSLSARINELIELGELERADSLINAQDIARLESEHAALQARTEQLRTDLSQSESATQASLHQLLSLYEGKRDIHIARYENDSAAVYWDKIVKLDTTNVENLLNAGLFVGKNLADYDKSMELFQMAFRNAFSQNKYIEVATSLNNIGIIYHNLAQYSLALEFYGKSLAIWLARLGDENENEGAATSYSNMGAVYFDQGKYALALENDEKALAIYLKTCGEESSGVAKVYSNMAKVYMKQSKYALALECQNKALSIFQKLYGETHPDVAITYNGMGGIYTEQSQDALALDNYQKALSIQQKIYGDAHPDVAVSCNNIGAAYVRQKQYGLALKYYEKSLSIFLNVYGEEHPAVATSYANLGLLYVEREQYGQALEYYEKAFRLMDKLHDGDKLKLIPIIYICHSRYYAQSPEVAQSAYEEFIANHMIAARVVPGGTASKLGLSGTYYILEFGEWQTESLDNMYEVNARMNGQSKDVVFYRDGEFIKKHFENQVGVQLEVTTVDKDVRKTIVKAWKKWKE